MTGHETAATNLAEMGANAILNDPQRTDPKLAREFMNILLAVFLFGVVLLALDLLTAPKYTDRAPRPSLKESRRAA